MIIQKDWGQINRHYFTRADGFIVDELQICLCEKSSIHRHSHTANYFSVFSGMLIIEQWDEKNKIHDMPTVVTTLNSGESITILPGTWHRFRAESFVHAIEISYPSAPADIERA